MWKRQRSRWEEQLSEEFAGALRSRRPDLRVRQMPTPVPIAAVNWLIEQPSSNLRFTWGCVRVDERTVEGLNIEVPPALRGKGLTSVLRECLAEALRLHGVASVVFDAGQDGAIVWARTLPDVTWDRSRMIDALPKMIDEAVATWPTTVDADLLLSELSRTSGLSLVRGPRLATRSLSDRAALVEQTVGPNYFCSAVAGKTTVAYRGFEVGIGEFTLTRNEGWRGLLRL